MANQVEKFGFRPVRKLDGSPFINAQNKYRIASNYGTAIFQGDLVVPVTDGTVPTTQKPTWKNYYPGSVVASDITAFVLDDPDIVGKMDCDGAFAVADIFKDFNVTNVSGNTQSGISEVQLDFSASGLTIAFMLQAIDISQNPDNDEAGAANVNVLVRINNHFYRLNTGL